MFQVGDVTGKFIRAEVRVSDSSLTNSPYSYTTPVVGPVVSNNPPPAQPLAALADGVISGTGVIGQTLTLDTEGTFTGGTAPFTTTYRWEYTDPKNTAAAAVAPTGPTQGQKTYAPSVMADQKEFSCITIITDSTNAVLEIPSNKITIKSGFTEIDPELRGTVKVGERVQIFSGRLERPAGTPVPGDQVNFLTGGCILEVSTDNGQNWQSVTGHSSPTYNNTTDWDIPSELHIQGGTSTPAAGMMLQVKTILTDLQNGGTVIAILESQTYTIAPAGATARSLPLAAPPSEQAPATAAPVSGPAGLRKHGPYSTNKWMANAIPDADFTGCTQPVTSTLQWQVCAAADDITDDSNWSDLSGPMSAADSLRPDSYRPKADILGKWIRVVQTSTDSSVPPRVGVFPGPAIGPIQETIPLQGAIYQIEMKNGAPCQVGNVVVLKEVRPPSNGQAPYSDEVHWKVLDHSYDRISQGHGTEQAEKSMELTLTAAMVGKYIGASVEYADSSNPAWTGHVSASGTAPGNPQQPLGPVVA